jgi:hypothetical protein
VSVGWSLHPRHFKRTQALGSYLPLQQRVRSHRLADDSVDKRQRKYVYGGGREIVHNRCGPRALRLVC